MLISRCWGTGRVELAANQKRWREKKKGVRGKKIKEIQRDRNVNRKQGNSAEYFLKN